VRASLLGAAPCHDLALLQLSLPPGYEALELAPDDPSRTERVAAMGYPLGVDGAPDQGQPRSAFGEVVDPEVYVTNDPAGALIRHSAWLGNGDSGGPLVDMRGRVVGVNRSVLVGIRSASLAIPVSTVREVVPDLAAGRNVC
jgi:putative serine protease PepD